MHLYDLFVERDAEVVEINPMLITYDNKLVVNHAKILIDRDSEYRQQELVMQRDLSQQNFKERIGQNAQLRYVHMEGGSVGLISNGAGYSMATCDLLAIHGAKASNFLDLGG